MKNKKYFSESSIIQAGESVRHKLSSHNSMRSADLWAGKIIVNKSASEIRNAFRKAVEKVT